MCMQHFSVVHILWTTEILYDIISIGSDCVMDSKVSVRFYNSIPIRARWDNDNKKWLYAASDVVMALTGSQNSRRYWNKVKSRNRELSTICGQLKMKASDGKYYLTDVLDNEGITILLMIIGGKNKLEFAKWVKGLASPIDEESRNRAYELFYNGLLDNMIEGSYESLEKIHSYLFDGLYAFAGKMRSKNISKGGFIFANCMFLPAILNDITNMPMDTFEQIVKKYVDMNIAHPFMEGNGRATRIWLDLILKRRLKKMIDWSKIDKKDYLNAMEESPINQEPIFKLLNNALIDDIDNHELFIKGIDYSYYYEEIE